MPTHSPNYKPFLAYLTPSEYAKLKKFAKASKMPMTQVIREAITARVATGNPYIKGFNDGLEEAIMSVNAMQHAQMRFPSGKSFAELVSDDLIGRRLKEVQDETGRKQESVSGV